MYQIYWLGLGIFATIMTLAWLFPALFGAPDPEFGRVTLTSLVSFLAWGVMALYAPTVETIQGGSVIDAAVSIEVQLFVAALSVVSLLTLVLYQLGVYPPEANEIPQPDQ